MKIALIGVTGRVGSRLLAELLKRGHTVTGIARHAPVTKPPIGVSVIAADATDSGRLAEFLAGHDAVISATRFESSDPAALLAAFKKSGVPRLLVVGGAASLEVAPGKRLLDAPDFPDAYKVEAIAGLRFLEALRQAKSLNWTFLSPSAEFAPDERRGTFRIGKDDLLVDPNGKSWISMEDFAIAMVDELEDPKHAGERFTVGY